MDIATMAKDEKTAEALASLVTQARLLVVCSKEQTDDTPEERVNRIMGVIGNIAPIINTIKQAKPEIDMTEWEEHRRSLIETTDSLNEAIDAFNAATYKARRNLSLASQKYEAQRAIVEEFIDKNVDAMEAYVEASPIGLDGLRREQGLQRERVRRVIGSWKATKNSLPDVPGLPEEETLENVEDAEEYTSDLVSP